MDPTSPRPSAFQNQGEKEMTDVVIPVFNEREILPLFLDRIEALPLPLNLIFVDNRSTDGTVEFLKAKPGITLISHSNNLGYGRSLIDGLLCSTVEKVIIIDADCEYPPESIPRLLDRLTTASVVYGSRFLSGGPVDMSPSRKWGNKMLTFFFNLLYHQGLSDLYTGMKAIRREAFQDLSFTRSGFEHVVELAACLALRGHHIVEIPIAYTPRQTGRSEMRHLKEVLKALMVMISCRLHNHGGN